MAKIQWTISYVDVDCLANNDDVCNVCEDAYDDGDDDGDDDCWYDWVGYIFNIFL